MAYLLAGKRALVTGASKGIGAGIALGLAREGADVAVNYHADAGGAAEVVAQVQALGRVAVAIGADVGQVGECQRLVKEAAAALGGIARGRTAAISPRCTGSCLPLMTSLRGGGVGFAHPQEIDIQEKEGNDFDLSKASPPDNDFPADPDAIPAPQITPCSPLPLPLPPPPTTSAKAVPLPPPPADLVRAYLTPYVADIARELRDRAKLTASVTRVYRVWQVSGLPVESFTARMQAARAITQERSAAIRDRAPDGQARKFGYFCAVLMDQCGAKPHAAEPMRPASAHPVAPVDAPIPPHNREVADTAAPPPRVMPPLPPPAVRDRERAIFWERLRVETGIGDLRAFAREFDRPPPSPGDAAATVAWVRAARRRRQ